MKFGILAAIAAVTAQSASACTAIPPPFDPRGRQFDAIVQGRVIARTVNRAFVTAEIAIRRTVSGRYPSNRIRVQWLNEIPGGMCPSDSAPLVAGQHVVVYLSRHEGKLVPRGWLAVRPAPRR